MAIIVNNKAGETCLICGEKKTEGIHILNQLICQSCEKKLIETKTNDVMYKEYIKKMGKLTTPINQMAKTHHH